MTVHDINLCFSESVITPFFLPPFFCFGSWDHLIGAGGGGAQAKSRFPPRMAKPRG